MCSPRVEGHAASAGAPIDGPKRGQKREKGHSPETVTLFDLPSWLGLPC